MQYLSSLKNLFGGSGHRTVPEWIRLQLFYNAGARHVASPGPDDDIEQVPAAVSKSRRRGSHTSSLLYLCILFPKSMAKQWNSRFPGWRSGIAGFSILATVTFIANLSALVWTATHLDGGYFATVSTQSCARIENLSFYAHTIISALSAGLLAGSNYCMQCLSSPTRAEIDAAHAQSRHLNIGIFSWRNIFSFRSQRIFLLLALVLSSLPLHLLYHASLSIEKAVQIYDIALVTPEFLSGGSWAPLDNQSHFYGNIAEKQLAKLQNLTSNGQIRDKSLWANVSADECAQCGPLDTDHGSILFVTVGSESLLTASTVSTLPATRSTAPDHHNTTVFDFNRVTPFNWGYFDDSRVAYCLSRRVPGRCRLQLQIWLLLAVVILNIVKIACYIRTFHEQIGTPLLTVGDAVASFLDKHCTVSKGMCLLSAKDISKTLSQQTYDPANCERKEVKRFRAFHLRYYNSISILRWSTYATSFVAAVLTSIYLYNLKVATPRRGILSIRPHLGELWKTRAKVLNIDYSFLVSPSWCGLDISFGEASTRCLYGDGMIHRLIAAAPQVVVSTIYLAVNYQVTLMIHLRDWTRLAARRQPLRVSNPERGSAQTSTYWLSLPYRYSVPLMASSVMLSWLMSKAIFFYHFTVFDDDGAIQTEYNEIPTYGISYTEYYIVLSIIAGGCVFAISLLFGLRKCPPGLPLGPTNSLVVAAACHPPDGDDNAARKLVQWGVIEQTPRNIGREERPVLHCTITSRKVEAPTEGSRYA